MKKFTNAKIVLFDSTAAFFKVSVEAIFTKKRQDNTLAPLAYITDQGTAHMNPNIYLVLTYKTDNWETTKNLYTSFPQLFSLREKLEQIKDLIISGEGYKEIEGVLNVNPSNQSPIVMADIGQKNKWISFGLTTIAPKEGEMDRVPGVSIQMSDTDGYISILTVEEFLTVYTIIKDIDLASYQIMLTGMFLEAESATVQPQQQYQRNYNNQTQYQQPAPQQNYQQPQGNYQQPAPQQNYQQPQRNAAPSYSRTGYQQPQRTQAPQQQPAPQMQNQQQQLPGRRNEQTIVSLRNVEETKVSSVNFNDDDAVDKIFKDEE
jgi:hypothetical protein